MPVTGTAPTRLRMSLNEIRTAFFDWLGLDPLPASTGIQARLCREDLLVEIEAVAVMPRGGRR